MVDESPLTIAEAAAVLGVHHRTIRRMLSDGRLKGTQRRDRIYEIPRSEVARVMRETESRSVARVSGKEAAEALAASLSTATARAMDRARVDPRHRKELLAAATEAVGLTNTVIQTGSLIAKISRLLGDEDDEARHQK